MKILIVDDELPICKLLNFNIKKAGFETQIANDGAQALKTIEDDKPDLVVLDIMLPGLDGIEVLREIRKKHVRLPVVLLTARDTELDRVLGLEMGADDYVVKPFSPRELVARVKAVLRRAAGGATAEDGEDVLADGGLKVNISSHDVTFNHKHVDLTPKEFELLVFLMQNRGRVFSRESLLDKVWGYEYLGDSRIVDVHISHLRDKIEPDPKNPSYIKTVRGIGYKFQREEDD